MNFRFVNNVKCINIAILIWYLRRMLLFFCSFNFKFKAHELWFWGHIFFIDHPWTTHTHMQPKHKFQSQQKISSSIHLSFCCWLFLLFYRRAVPSHAIRSGKKLTSRSLLELTRWRYIDNNRYGFRYRGPIFFSSCDRFELKTKTINFFPTKILEKKRNSSTDLTCHRSHYWLVLVFFILLSIQLHVKHENVHLA